MNEELFIIAKTISFLEEYRNDLNTRIKGANNPLFSKKLGKMKSLVIDETLEKIARLEEILEELKAYYRCKVND